MSSYLSLIRFPEQGIRNINDSPQCYDAFRQTVEAEGGRVIFLYMTLGEDDLATVVDVPDDERAAQLLLSVGNLGNVRTTTMRAFTEEEFRRIVGGLPWLTALSEGCDGFCARC